MPQATTRNPGTVRPCDTLLAAASALLVAYAAACKALLFRNHEYIGNDLYSFLDMSRSWWTSGRLLYENAYGNHAAIHNFYLLLAFAPLTLGLGAYGFVLGLALLYALAALGACCCRALDLPGRIAVLAGLLSPLAFYAADDRTWGFHPELCYPPLAVLLALALAEGRRGRALLAGAAVVLVKEDGALVCFGLLVAHFAARLLDEGADPEERRRLARRACLALGSVGLVFLAGLGLLWWMSQGAVEGQVTAVERLQRATGIFVRTLPAEGPAGRRAALVQLLGGYAVAAVLLLLPLAGRIARALLLLLLASPPVLAALVVSDAHYRFADLLWSPRAATWMALVSGCVVAAASPRPAALAGSRRGWSVAWVAGLALVSWAAQLPLLDRLSSPIGARLDLVRLWDGRGSVAEALPREELRSWHCLARRLPVGLPVSAPALLYPVFHRQSIVFQGLEAHAARPARVRIGGAGDAVAAPEGSCTGALGAFRVALDCELRPALDGCGFR